jgi:hypothetical protein
VEVEGVKGRLRSVRAIFVSQTYKHDGTERIPDCIIEDTDTNSVTYDYDTKYSPFAAIL